MRCQHALGLALFASVLSVRSLSEQPPKTYLGIGRIMIVLVFELRQSRIGETRGIRFSVFFLSIVTMLPSMCHPSVSLHAPERESSLCTNFTLLLPNKFSTTTVSGFCMSECSMRTLNDSTLGWVDFGTGTQVGAVVIDNGLKKFFLLFFKFLI
jgi:hypothetical protein